MSDVMTAGTLSFSAADTQQNLPGSLECPYRLVIRANDPGIFVGGNGLDSAPLPGNGFEMVQDREYIFDLEPGVGTNQQAGVYVAHAVTGTVSVSFVLTPKR